MTMGQVDAGKSVGQHSAGQSVQPLRSLVLMADEHPLDHSIG